MDYTRFEQQKLHLDFRKEFDEFIVDYSNKDAFDLLNDCDEFCVLLVGPTGCGKTHLSHVWMDKLSAKFSLKGKVLCIDHFYDLSGINNSNNSNQKIYNDYSVYVIDNAHELFFSNRESHYELQKNFFHFYNKSLLSQKKILINSGLPITDWIFAFPDIESRIKSIPMIKMHAPSDVLLKSVIKKLFINLEIYVSNEIVEFIFYRIERSFESARNIVEFIVNISSMHKRSISIAFLREIFSEIF